MGLKTELNGSERVVNPPYVNGAGMAQWDSGIGRKVGGGAVGSARQPWIPTRTADTKRAMQTTILAMSAGSRQREGTTGILLSCTGPSEPSWRTSLSFSSGCRSRPDCPASAPGQDSLVPETRWA